MNWPDGPKPTWERWAEGDCDEERPQPRPVEFPDLMTSYQAAAFLGVSKDWVNTLVRQGRLEAVRKGRRNYFHKVDLVVYTVEKGD